MKFELGGVRGAGIAAASSCGGSWFGAERATSSVYDYYDVVYIVGVNLQILNLSRLTNGKDMLKTTVPTGRPLVRFIYGVNTHCVKLLGFIGAEVCRPGEEPFQCCTASINCANQAVPSKEDNMLGAGDGWSEDNADDEHDDEGIIAERRDAVSPIY
uniref:Uncharacterized protein n=1 Tax=Glossina austeni TaxID=7395 RepID=A0A1A9UL02_GLOAU